MYRALVVLRVVLMANMVGLNVYRGFEHPVGGFTLVGALVVWTGVVSWALSAASRRTPGWLLADLAVAVAALAATGVVKAPGFDSTVPGFWVMGAMIAWAIHWRWQGGLVSAVVLAATDVASRHYVSESVYGNLFLLLVGGPIVGLMVDSLARAAVARAAADRATAAAAERTRLARAVHDGVLQVLALVQRRGPDLGDVGVELGRLAGEQETALRALIREQDAVVAGPAVVDLVGALSALERRRGVSVAVPEAGVHLGRETAEGIVAVVSACLDNVVTHVGADAPAWVLLEAFPESLKVSVRDEGPGIPEDRLDQAEAEGRFGVSSSIRGRVAELRGTAELVTGSFGTEWELTFPR